MPAVGGQSPAESPAPARPLAGRSGRPRPATASPTQPAPGPPAGNRIKLQDLSILTSLSSLHSLDLEGNPASDLEEYRARVFEMLAVLPHLTAVDELNKQGEGAQESFDDIALVLGPQIAVGGAPDCPTQPQEPLARARGAASPPSGGRRGRGRAAADSCAAPAFEPAPAPSLPLQMR